MESGDRHRAAHRSLWPRSLLGATRSRTSCFNSLISGKRRWSARDQITAPSTRISKTPPEPGTRATSRISLSNVVSSSCAIHAARNSHRHCVQYSISIRGRSDTSQGSSRPWLLPVHRNHPPCDPARRVVGINRDRVIAGEQGNRTGGPVRRAQCGSTGATVGRPFHGHDAHTVRGATVKSNRRSARRQDRTGRRCDG